MTEFTDYARIFTGWCPNPPFLRTAPVIHAPATGSGHPIQQDGGAGGPGRSARGIGLVSESIGTLVRNRQLLVFSFLAGLVVAFMFAAHYALQLLSVYPYNAIDPLRWLVLTFAIELATVFGITVLFAGLVMSLPPEGSAETVSFRRGLARAKGFLRPLADWSVIVSLAGTAVFVLLLRAGFSQFSFSPVLNRFPFTFIFLPEVYSTGPIGGTYAMLTAAYSTAVFSAINIALFCLTLFVVPLIVLENRRLLKAVEGSCAIMKNVLGGMAVLFLTLGAVVFAASLVSFLFGAVYGILSPGMLLFWYPGDAWIAAALLYLLAFCALAVVCSTVAGIGALGLYNQGRAGTGPGPKGRRHEGNGSVS